MPIPFEVEPALSFQHVSALASTVASIGVDAITSTTDLATSFTTTSTVAAATSIAAASGGEGGPSDGGETECRLLGPFALIVQLALGALALLSLVYKRWRERPQRPLKIWFFDASKQVFGSVLVHGANVFMSMLTSGRFSIDKLDSVAVQATARFIPRTTEMPYVPNPCSFYLLNLAIDTTIGIPILILLLRILTALVSYTPLGKPSESIQSGNYGDPPKAWWWLKQSIIYFCGLFGMKLCVLVIFLILPWISRVGDWALKWTEGNERLQIIFVMMLFPVIMNALQYYIIDSFIKAKSPGHGHQRIPSEDSTGDRDSFDDSFNDHQDDASIASGESSASVKPLKPNGKGKKAEREEYDPELDGQTVVGSSRSQEGERIKTLPKELVPHE
ncbi:vacuolar membrane protein-domain-containing protein [Xylariaceae sp. FL1019]|nr:vacuolar membrane protein-domain-containing protein [Xylariaceae sp. FL1019]